MTSTLRQLIVILKPDQEDPMNITRGIQRIAVAAIVAVSVATPFSSAAGAETYEIELQGVKPIGPDQSQPWKKPLKTNLPWWWTPPKINTAPELDREHEPICRGNTIYARFTDAESATADLTVTAHYTNTSGDYASAAMEMRPRVEDHVVTISDLRIPAIVTENMVSIHAVDPQGGRYSLTLNRECVITFYERLVP